MGRNVAVWLALAMTLFASGCSSASAPTPPPTPPVSAGTPLPAATRFLANYVTADGRVIRHDQGGDIVSEGQAYGMLIAELAARPSTVRSIWSWTAGHLQRADGLLRYHASSAGQIEDSQPASDADVLSAYALLRYSGTDAATLHEAGRRIAQAVLAAESTTWHGSPVLTAGPWALATSPPTVNPSYFMPSVFDALAAYTGDDRWHSAAQTAVALVEQLTGNGNSLPTDWTRLDGSGLTSIPDPSGAAPVQYGLDAARLPIWFATSCDVKAKQLAASWWSNRLRFDHRAADLALSSSGTPIDRQTNPVPYLAAAAAATAAGDHAASRSLRQQAVRQARQTPTYYGDAWLAIAGALLDRSLNPCQEAADG